MHGQKTYNFSFSGHPIIRIKLKNKIGGSMFRTIFKYGNNFRFLRILATQNRFQLLYDELFNIDKFLE